MVQTAFSLEAPYFANAASRLLNEGYDRPSARTDSQATELFLVCHGHADYGSSRMKAERWDPPLSEKGRCQAMRLAVRMETMPIDAIYTSTLTRASGTAAVVAAVKNLPIIRLADRREVDFHGTMVAGFDCADREKAMDAMLANFLRYPFSDNKPGREPSHRFRARVLRAINAIIDRHRGGRVVLITHRTVINYYLAQVIDLKGDFFFLAGYGSITVVRTHSDIAHLQRLNDMAHLLPSFAPA